MRTRIAAANANKIAHRMGPVPPVLLEVIDTGSGMDEDTQRHCFELFFTTKGERGTGLGLAMWYGMRSARRSNSN